MKKILSTLLVVMLLANTTIAAFADTKVASGDSKQRLQSVTLLVKNTLGISDKYNEFHGDIYENELIPVWNLEWSCKEGRVSVEALESGKVVSYYTYDTDDETDTNRKIAKLPSVDRDKSIEIALKFMDKVLDKDIESVNRGTIESNFGNDRFRVYGDILLKKTNSHMEFSLAVDAYTGKVISFNRDIIEGTIVGEIPSEKTNINKNNAGALLRDTLKLELKYVLDDKTNTAYLQYTPLDIDQYFVDAASGKLVNLSEIYRNIGNSSIGGSSDTLNKNENGYVTEDSASGGLTEVELEGTDKIKGILPKNTIDNRLKQNRYIGINKYNLSSITYRFDKDNDRYIAIARYIYKTDEVYSSKTIECDAKTAEILSIYSNSNRDNEKGTVKLDDAKRTAESFLRLVAGSEFWQTGLKATNSSETEYSFGYCQKKNNYFLDSNLLTVDIDNVDGTVSRYYKNWVKDVKFDDTKNLISESKALDTWYNHYNVKLAYLPVPVKLADIDIETPLRDTLEKLGHKYYYQLKLVYALSDSDNNCIAVDAKTGKLINNTINDTQYYRYTDVDKHIHGGKLNVLKQFNIGWYGDKCKPDTKLTQVDAIELILSACGYRYNPNNEYVDYMGRDSVDRLYQAAYSNGLLEKSEREDTKLMSRGDMLVMLVNTLGYGEIAEMKSLFNEKYAPKVSDKLTGYVAIANGLGIVNGANIDVNSIINRAEAAVLLFNYVSK